MGLCLPCMGGAVKDVVETPDPEIKRRQLAEAAEKRQMEASSRGIKNIYSVEQKKKKQEEIEKRMAASGLGGEGGLRELKVWPDVVILQIMLQFSLRIFQREVGIGEIACDEPQLSPAKANRKNPAGFNGTRTGLCMPNSAT
ncbi:hypothetical protein CIB84_002153 [Bambusicola thoracicus]|uniref:Small VCP/p97-interacting protein n=1 Tax=Bambusicola thoracicus TaxID=9083 RepID=A0A2P4TCL0_BAMTH|nr:hypothetical protein CIB84_002153 [Bambusicola thoracicus]